MIGSLVKLQFESFVHPNVRGMIGIVLSRPNGHGQYEVFVMGYKTLYLLKNCNLVFQPFFLNFHPYQFYSTHKVDYNF